jgi:hypothetical protein
VRIVVIILTVVVGLVGAGWIGLRVKPQPFPVFSSATPELATVPLPDGLPAPVERFYRAITGERVPVITSGVFTGTAQLTFNGITFPSRLRFTHEAGQNYRHYIESAVFGQPLLKVNETYLDGIGRMELPFGVVENEPKINMAANLGLWGESIWLPSLFVTDPRTRWEAVDENSARLYVPFGDEEDTFTAVFDPETGLLAYMEAMRYREATDEARIPWRLEPIVWEPVHGMMIPIVSAVTWGDQGKPWLVITLDDVAYNVDVSEYIRGRGL